MANLLPQSWPCINYPSSGRRFAGEGKAEREREEEDETNLGEGKDGEDLYESILGLCQSFYPEDGV